jgi:hypothetical protein
MQKALNRDGMAPLMSLWGARNNFEEEAVLKKKLEEGKLKVKKRAVELVDGKLATCQDSDDEEQDKGFMNRTVLYRKMHTLQRILWLVGQVSLSKDKPFSRFISLVKGKFEFYGAFQKSIYDAVNDAMLSLYSRHLGNKKLTVDENLDQQWDLVVSIMRKKVDDKINAGKGEKGGNGDKGKGKKGKGKGDEDNSQWGGRNDGDDVCLPASKYGNDKKKFNLTGVCIAFHFDDQGCVDCDSGKPCWRNFQGLYVCPVPGCTQKGQGHRAKVAHPEEYKHWIEVGKQKKARKGQGKGGNNF